MPMTYVQQNAKLVLIGKNSTLLLDSSLNKCVDAMFDNTPIETAKFYKIVTADLTFHISVQILLLANVIVETLISKG